MRWPKRTYLMVPAMLAATSCGGARTPVSSAPPLTLRYVEEGETWQVDPTSRAARPIIAGRYGAFTRATLDTPWDLHDPRSGKLLAPFAEGTGGDQGGDEAAGAKLESSVEILAVDASGATRVPIEGAHFDGPLVWGTLARGGSLLFVSTSEGAFVATRSAGPVLAFGALHPVGHGVRIVHDVSPDGAFAIASGHRAVKWQDPANVVAPRQVSVFRIDAEGQLTEDVTALRFPALVDAFVQTPTFMPGGDGILYEGDDDADTGDRLFVVHGGGAPPAEIKPAHLEKNDFNTPCSLEDGRVAFWEASMQRYALRVFDPARGTTTTLTDWLPFSGYVRCR